MSLNPNTINQLDTSVLVGSNLMLNMLGKFSAEAILKYLSWFFLFFCLFVFVLVFQEENKV